ncbi:unnamed protein product [Orchesella dallaii]|uniref:G-protein coupled receptors family 3 profile domain-containing protein n=1 Tax=Orchesella dallaii TaxID=48710 RepID=A0ABP1QG05_9HEXA
MNRQWDSHEKRFFSRLYESQLGPRTGDMGGELRFYHRGLRFHQFRFNDTAMTEQIPDIILNVTYEDGKWSKPYFDCGGANIWMITYTVPFFGYDKSSEKYFFKGTSGVDIDLRRVDIDQCPLPDNSTELNIFAGSDKCKNATTMCVPMKGLGFRRGSYRCICKDGFYFPNVSSPHKYYNGTLLEEEYEKKFDSNETSYYDWEGTFECLRCPGGCDTCVDDRPCVVSLNWLMRSAILILQCAIILMLPIVGLFTFKYSDVKVVRAASPVLLRFIVLGAFFIYCTILVMYPSPSVITCTLRVWLREIGFSLAYGALMLKTWRISVIFRVRSAKAIKITDLDLMKRLGIIVAMFTALLVIRTLVAPPAAIVSLTADDLKAWLCKTDWWDHSFTLRSKYVWLNDCPCPGLLGEVIQLD